MAVVGAMACGKAGDSGRAEGFMQMGLVMSLLAEWLCLGSLLEGARPAHRHPAEEGEEMMKGLAGWQGLFARLVWSPSGWRA